MKTPETIQDIEGFVERKTPESIHLDYKASPALSKKKKDEICKDVSAFANSDGGMLIYGVKEEHTFPTETDEGVDTNQINKEWIDEILATNITPVISGIEIIEIKKTETNSIFVINIQKSYRGPHQAPDKKYYKRYNARSAPMEHYEIDDVRNRRQIVSSLISVDIQINPLVQIVVENIGDKPAHDVKFIFSENFSWFKELPNALKNGIKFFPPNRKIKFTVGSLINFLHKDSKIDSFFNVAVYYNHPQLGYETKEDIHIDLNDFLNSDIQENYLKSISDNLKVLKNIPDELSKLNQCLKNIESISGATGLDLSISTLVNLNKMLNNDKSFQYVNLEECPLDVIQEVLKVDYAMARNIHCHYHFNDKGTAMEAIPGMTEELLEKIKKHTKASC